jgi:predicted amidohydrolase
MERVRIALIQMDIKRGDWETNVKRVFSFLEQVSNLQAQICLLPEMWSTGFALDHNFPILAKKYFQETLDLMRSWSHKFHLYLLGGTIPEVSEEKIYNTSFFLSPFGEILGFYRKRILFPLLREDKYFTPGSGIQCLKTPWGKMGVMICYELRFPAGFQELRLQGARVVFVPAQFPRPRESHWVTLLRARAIENQYYIVACNRVGEDSSSLSYFGNSMIVDPWGEVLLQAREKETVLSLEVELSLVEKIRSEFPLYQDR